MNCLTHHYINILIYFIFNPVHCMGNFGLHLYFCKKYRYSSTFVIHKVYNDL